MLLCSRFDGDFQVGPQFRNADFSCDAIGVVLQGMTASDEEQAKEQRKKNRFGTHRLAPKTNESYELWGYSEAFFREWLSSHL